MFPRFLSLRKSKLRLCEIERNSLNAAPIWLTIVSIFSSFSLVLACESCSLMPASEPQMPSCISCASLLRSNPCPSKMPLMRLSSCSCSSLMISWRWILCFLRLISRWVLTLWRKKTPPRATVPTARGSQIRWPACGCFGFPGFFVRRAIFAFFLHPP